MCSSTVNVLFTLISQILLAKQAHATQNFDNRTVDELGNNLTNSLFDRVLKASARQHVDSHSLITGKPGHLALPFRMSPRVVASRPLVTHIDRGTASSWSAAAGQNGQASADRSPLPTSGTGVIDGDPRETMEKAYNRPSEGLVFPGLTGIIGLQGQGSKPLGSPGMTGKDLRAAMESTFQDLSVQHPIEGPASDSKIEDPVMQRQTRMQMMSAVAQARATRLRHKDDPRLKPIFGNLQQKRGLVTPQISKDITPAAAVMKDYPTSKLLDTVTPRTMAPTTMQKAFAKIKEKLTDKHGLWDKVRRAATSPRAALLLVPLMWATHGPLMRGIYALDGCAPSSSMITALRAVIITGMFMMWEKFQASRSASKIVETPASVDKNEDAKPAWNQMEMAKYAVILGALNFFGTALHTDALSQVTATKAAFLVSIKTVFVPLIAPIVSTFVPTAKHWVTSLIALAGTSLILFGKGGSPSEMLGALGFADLELLVASVSYAATTVFWGKALKSLPQAELLTRKNAIYAGICVLWLTWDFMHGKTLWPNQGWINPGIWVAILASSLFTGVLFRDFSSQGSIHHSSAGSANCLHAHARVRGNDGNGTVRRDDGTCRSCWSSHCRWRSFVGTLIGQCIERSPSRQQTWLWKS
jgi:drug/metabolite transporter (DMT)-like permease